MLCLLPGQFALGLRYVDQLMLQSFDVSLTVHLSITLANDQLDTQFFFYYIYYNPLHVSSNILLILRRSNCINP